jgi:FlaA1/EpsC-like NDP-sugar epimerase
MATMLFRNEEALLRGTGDVEGFYLRYCLPKKIELNLQYAQRASVLQDVWIIVQTLCPYWLGVLMVYGLALTASLWVAYQLQFDFQVTHQTYREFWQFLPCMVIPQMFLLVWRGQIRGLLSYFSVSELRQTAVALGVALLLQLGLRLFSQGRLAPSNSLILIHFMVSFLSLCAVRMVFRLIRERSCRSRGLNQIAVQRVAIIGTGELATKLALDLGRSNDTGRRVVAFFGDDPHSWHKRPHDIPIVGMPECLLNAEWQLKIDEVIVALPEEDPERLQEIREMLKSLPVKATFASGWPVLRPLES